MALTITPVTGALGAVIDGVDLGDPGLDFAPIYQAFLDHEIIFFREVNLSEASNSSSAAASAPRASIRSRGSWAPRSRP